MADGKTAARLSFTTLPSPAAQPIGTAWVDSAALSWPVAGSRPSCCDRRHLAHCLARTDLTKELFCVRWL